MWDVKKKRKNAGRKTGSTKRERGSEGKISKI